MRRLLNVDYITTAKLVTSDPRAVEETGSKTKAAERLGIPRQSLQKMMKRLDLNE